jgi:hypothetical protein
MAAARIAAVSLAALLPLAAAQQPPQTHLTIQVTDQTAAFIPGARIEINPGLGHVLTVEVSPEPGHLLTTDSQGQAAIDLPMGSYDLTISAKGFATLTERVEVHEAAQMVNITLKVQSYSGPVVVAGPTIADLSEFGVRQSEPVYLALQPLLTFSPLAPQCLKKHCRRVR